MTRVTRFAGRDPGHAARVAGFIAHLRENGLRLGVGETETALLALQTVPHWQLQTARLALKSVCTGSHDDIRRFDDLFDSYWLNAGRVRDRAAPSNSAASKHAHSTAEAKGQSSATGRADSPDDGAEGEVSQSEGTGKLIASTAQNLFKKDLRDIVATGDIHEAELLAIRLGKALCDRRSRRRRAARKGDRIDFRRIMRKSLATGGEPLRLEWRKRPPRPVRIVALCDVSGSMALYARVFLAFLSGLIRADSRADAYLFHTRLVRIADALRDEDPMRALGKVTLLAEGFGGGSKIGANLDQFARSYARRFVDGRSVVFILSDGYDTDPPEMLAGALEKLKRRGCRIVWLNPLKGWAGYEPVARGMQAALPHLDAFRAASTLGDLAALEEELMTL